MKTTRLSCALSVASSRTAGTSSTWQSMATILIVQPAELNRRVAALHSTAPLALRPSLLVHNKCEGCNFFVLLLQLFFVAKIDFTQCPAVSEVCSHNAFMTNFAFMGDCKQAEPTLSHSLARGFLRGCVVGVCKSCIFFPNFQTCEPKIEPSSGARHSSCTHTPHLHLRCVQPSAAGFCDVQRKQARVITAQSQQAA
jgi:hypothetical protein